MAAWDSLRPGRRARVMWVEPLALLVVVIAMLTIAALLAPGGR